MSELKTDKHGRAVSNMPLPQFTPTRTDSNHIGSRIKQLVDLMLEGRTLSAAARELGVAKRTAERALAKPHVRQFARNRKAQVIEQLAANVPNRLHELMYGNNQNACVRAAAELHNLASAEQTARRSALGTPTPGLTIQIVSDSPKPLTINNSEIPQPAPVAIEHREPETPAQRPSRTFDGPVDKIRRWDARPESENSHAPQLIERKTE
jgi:hypothetical protein